jgi:hypothetical protein
VDFHHRLDDRLRRAGITEAEAGHREGLGKPVQQDRPLAHSRQRGDGNVRLIVVAEFAVDLIGEHDQVVLDGEFRDAFEVLARGAGTGRVGREIEHQHPRFGVMAFASASGFSENPSSLVVTTGDRHAMGHDDARTVGNIARLVVNHLVAGIEQGAQGDVDRLGNADRDEHLARRIVGNTEEIRRSGRWICAARAGRDSRCRWSGPFRASRWRLRGCAME